MRVEFCSKLALDERTPKPQRVTRLIALLRDDSVRVQAVACTAIADLDAASQVPFDTIAKLCASKDRLVRRAAIKLFPYISHNDKRAGMLLVRALDDPDSRVRFDAARRIGRYDAVVAESLPKLIRLLRPGFSCTRVFTFGNTNMKVAATRVMLLAHNGFCRVSLVPGGVKLLRVLFVGSISTRKRKPGLLKMFIEAAS